MRKSVCLLAGVLVLQIFLYNVYAGESDTRLFQVSTIAALKQGKYDGRLSFGELRKHGDFGIGTLNGLNGEMVAVGGQFYQVTIDGRVHRIGDGEKTPFALVLFFDHAKAVALDGKLNMKSLEETLDRQLPSLDRIWAIRLKGLFPNLTVRSVAEQHRPYPPLEKALEGQREFRLENSSGTLVGFRFPRFMAGVNVSGYHFHYIDREGHRGGHVLDFIATNPRLEALEVTDFVLRFSGNN